MRVITSETLDPFWNLAAESVLLDRVPRWGPMLMLWRSHRTVVIGKNQNPWRECSLQALDAGEGTLARRTSGGGAVYQDTGNLNYAYFCSRAAYDGEAVFARVVDALRELDLDARRLGRNGLGVDGRKISGTAFCIRKAGVLHHGTLLLDTDLERMAAVLTPAEARFDTHAVASQPADVVNLNEIRPGTGAEELTQCLVEVFARSDGGVTGELTVDDLDPDRMLPAHTEMLAWDWRFGRTPRFRITVPVSAGEERTDVCFEVVRGKIESAEAAGVIPPGLPAVLDALRGCRLQAEEVSERLDTASTPAVAVAHALRPFLAWISTDQS